MSYTPNTWANGDTITAQKLNNIEQGVANNVPDAIIDIYHSNNSGDSYEFTIVSGSYNSLKTLFLNNIAPSILVRIFDDYTNYIGCTNTVHFYSLPSTTYPNATICMFIFAQRYSASNSYDANNWWSMTYLYWNNEDELFLD